MYFTNMSKYVKWFSGKCDRDTFIHSYTFDPTWVRVSRREKQSIILLFPGDIRHARRVFEQSTGGQRGGEGEEHIRKDGREQRRAADARRIPEGLPPGRGAVEDARSLIPTSPYFRSRRRAIVNEDTHHYH